jgi:phosphotransferase system HPr (HPr) family protein
MKQCSRIVVVGNERGIHSRIATRLAAIATDCAVQLELSNGRETADCSMILDVLALGVVQGERLHIRAAGRQAQQALAAVEHLLAAEEDP